jgi:asparagine synthase (glutamine-hydrolysing)
MRYTRRSAWQTLRGDVFPAFTPARLVDAVSWAQRGFQSPWSTRPIARDFALKLFTEGKASPTRVRGARSRKRWRANALRILHLQLNAASVPPASLAASYGLAFSRPFHDKRIVEFALSIPEDLYFKHGRERHLARRAFGDRLPRDLLDRRPGNTTDNPDFFRMATSAAPSALDEVRRLDRDGSLSRYVDFEKIERSLALVGNDDNPSLYLTLLMAVRAIAVARFLAWFDRQNS